MMRSRKITKLALAMAIPVGLFASLGTAGVAAAKAAPTSGALSCHLSATVSFNPPLSPGNGAEGFSKEITTVSNETLTGCTGASTPSATQPTSGIGKNTTIKSAGIKVGKIKYAGSCSSFATTALPAIKSAFTWNTGIKASKALEPTSTLNIGVNDGFDATGTVTKGSYSGEAISVNAYFDTASSAALVNCALGTGSVASATIVSSLSTVSIG